MEAESTLVEKTFSGRVWVLVDPLGLVGGKQGGILVLGVPLGLDVEVGGVDKVSGLVDRKHGSVKCGVKNVKSSDEGA